MTGPTLMSFPLDEAGAAKRSEAQRVKGLFVGIVGVFWSVALLFYVTPSRAPTWLHIGVFLFFLIVPILGWLIAKNLQPQRFAAVRVPLRLLLSEGGLEVVYERGPPVATKWNDPALNLTVFEARHPNREPMRWLYVSDMSVYQGIKLPQNAFDALTRVAEGRHLVKQVNTRVARFPVRELTWTVYATSPVGTA